MTIGESTHVSSVIDEVKDPAFATAVGLTLWGYAIKSSTGKRFNFQFKGVDQIADQVRKWIKSLIP